MDPRNRKLDLHSFHSLVYKRSYNPSCRKFSSSLSFSQISTRGIRQKRKEKSTDQSQFWCIVYELGDREERDCKIKLKVR